MKTFVVVLLAAMSAASGEALLSYAMKRNGQVSIDEPSQWFGLVFSVVRNPYVFAGVVFLAVYFFLYMAALSWDDLSFVLPLTAVSYIFAALLARFFLNEEISFLRWAGTIVIIVGIGMVAFDSSRKETGSYRVAGADSTVGKSQIRDSGNEGS